MNDEIMITVPMTRYEELLNAEARLNFLREYVQHETMLHDDIKYFLGIKDEGKSDEQ